VTSEPTGSSEAPVPVSPSDGDPPTTWEEGVVVPSSYPDLARLPPSRRGQSGKKSDVKRTNRSVAGRAAQRSSEALIATTPRENIPPKNELDANDRSDIRATRSAGALERQIKLEQHRDWLEWQRTKRYLVFFGGLIALSTVFAFALKYAGLPPKDVAKLTLLTFISGISGYGLRTLSTKVWYAISSRDRSDQGGSRR
jgi:hypothetical protein